MKKAIILLLLLPSALFSQNKLVTISGVETAGYFSNDLSSKNSPSAKTSVESNVKTKTAINKAKTSPAKESNSNPLSADLIKIHYECGCIKWSTASETNCSHFLVMFSRDCKGWNILGQVYGAGNSSTTRNYNYPTDQSDVFFKIYQIDFNGEAREYQAIFGSCKKQKKS